jgi:hypothetical protein
VLNLDEQRALRELDAELTRRHPELAAALSFGRAPSPGARTRRTGVRRGLAIALGLTTVALFALAGLWGSEPPGACSPGAAMTNQAAFAAAADVSRPMPDNIGCVAPGPVRPG